MQPTKPLTAFTLLALASLACTISLGGPAAPPDSAVPSPEALASFNQKWLALPETLENGEFVLTFSEEEVVSAFEAALTSPPTETALPLKNPRITLNEGILLYTQTNGSLITASGSLLITPSIDSEGQLTAEVTPYEFKKVTFDDALLEQTSTTIAYALTGPTANLPVEITLTNVTVMDGQLVLTGKISE